MAFTCGQMKTNKKQLEKLIILQLHAAYLCSNWNWGIFASTLVSLIKHGVLTICLHAKSIDSQQDCNPKTVSQLDPVYLSQWTFTFVGFTIIITQDILIIIAPPSFILVQEEKIPHYLVLVMSSMIPDTNNKRDNQFHVFQNP
jgi:hypothetical protein